MHAKPNHRSSWINDVFDSSKAKLDVKNADILVCLNCS